MDRNVDMRNGDVDVRMSDLGELRDCGVLIRLVIDHRLDTDRGNGSRALNLGQLRYGGTGFVGDGDGN